MTGSVTRTLHAHLSNFAGKLGADFIQVIRLLTAILIVIAQESHPSPFGRMPYLQPFLSVSPASGIQVGP